MNKELLQKSAPNSFLRRFSRVLAVVLAGSFLALVGSTEGCKPKEKKAFGLDCGDDDDCESGDCSDVGSVCTKSCTFDKECGSGLVCRALSEAQNQCDKPVGQTAGGSCMLGGDCANGLCLHYVGKETQPGICSKFCQAADDCPAGYKICDKISDSGMLKVCLPGDAAAAASGTGAGKKFGKPSTAGKKKGEGKKKGGGGEGKKKGGGENEQAGGKKKHKNQ